MSQPLASQLTLQATRSGWYQRKNLPPDGGLAKAWVDFKVGPIPMPFPNSDARRRAVPRHDSHHILGDYDTSFIGELEISGYEIGAGCGKFLVPWHLNLLGFAAGALLCPRLLWRAFCRGRRAKSLYLRDDFESVELNAVEQVRSMLGIREKTSTVEATAADGLWFAAAAISGGLVTVLTALLLLTPLTPLLWAWLFLKHRSAV
jgi:hypothetical protein